MPGLKVYLQAYTTDGQEALRQCLAQEFERSVSFLCKVHLVRNIKEKCHQLHISESATTHILDDIFGSDDIVNAQTQEKYTSMFDLELRRKWDSLERRDTDKYPKFATYFEKHKRDDIWNHATPEVLYKFDK